MIDIFIRYMKNHTGEQFYKFIYKQITMTYDLFLPTHDHNPYQPNTGKI